MILSTHMKTSAANTSLACDDFNMVTSCTAFVPTQCGHQVQTGQPQSSIESKKLFVTQRERFSDDFDPQ